MPQQLQKRGGSPNRDAAEAKAMAEKSLKAGYLKDALKYLTVAQESDPLDFSVMLKLASTYNMMHDDREAIRWFKLAAQSPDPAIASEAEKAYKNLSPQFRLFRFTAWMFPFYSTRWKDAFGYGQVKEEMKLGSLPMRAYISMRFVGDVRGQVGPASGSQVPQYLSESSVIFGVGLATANFHGMTAWFEAGESVKYLSQPQGRRFSDPGLPRRPRLCQGFRTHDGRHARFVCRNERRRRVCQPFSERHASVLAESHWLHFLGRRIVPRRHGSLSFIGITT